MPRVGKKSGAGKTGAGLLPPEPMIEPAAQQAVHAAITSAEVHVGAEPRTPTQSPTRPHIGYFGRSSCPCWRCVRNMGPLQRRKECAPHEAAGARAAVTLIGPPAAHPIPPVPSTDVMSCA
jgi:hypothetical protein